MQKSNCWEFKQCGREPGGKNAIKYGVCVAALPGGHDGINGGKHAGRYCWAVVGTFCKCKIQGIFVDRSLGCHNCEFLTQVHEEEDKKFVLIK